MDKQKNVFVLEKTVSIKRFKEIFGFKQDRTVDVFLRKAKIRVVIRKGESFLSLDDILRHMKLKKLPKKFLDAEDVAKLFKSNQTRILALVKAGLLPCYHYGQERKGQRTLFIEEEIWEAKESLIEKDFEITYLSSYATTRFKLKEYENAFREILDFLKSKRLLLSNRQLDILFNLWLENKTPEELGEKYMLTRERIIQLFNKAKKRLVNFPLFTKGLFEEKEKLIVENRVLTARNRELLNQVVFLEKEIKRCVPDIKSLKEATPSELFAIPIVDLDLSVRTYNCLKAARIETLGEICNKTINELLKYRNFGRKSLREVTALMQERGLQFKED